VVLALTLVGGLLDSAPGAAHAQRATTFQCISACGAALARTCGGTHYYGGQWNRCVRRLYRVCRRWGPAAICPAVLATTTTTTTTTLPSQRFHDLRGSYLFQGSVIDDACGLVGTGAAVDVPFTVTSQSGTTLTGTLGRGRASATGTYTTATGGWNLGGPYFDTSIGCRTVSAIGIGDDDFFVGRGVGATWSYQEQCGTRSCFVEARGPVYRVAP